MLHVAAEPGGIFRDLGLQPLNVLSHYSFTLADTILAGEHRPLNQLENEFGEDLESPLASPDIDPGV